MSFKKDYINYLLQSLLHSSENNLYENQRVRNIAEKIISSDDIVKITFLIGKTAGMEMLFKYILYISDKIDKSQISIFNLRENFQYDFKNLEKIFLNISEYKADDVEKAMINMGAEADRTEENLNDEVEDTVIEDNSGIERQTEETQNSFTLIQNNEQAIEVFELGAESDAEAIEEMHQENIAETPSNEILPELQVEILKPISHEDAVKEETVTNEAYNRFETRFFEDVKILEKLFVSVGKECNSEDRTKCLQSLTEIIEITAELSGLARQLSFDLIADIFQTMNVYFTKAVSNTKIILPENLRLFDSSLALVNSLIKNEDYLNYDYVVDRIEKLKSEIHIKETDEIEKYLPEEKNQEEMNVYPEKTEDEKYIFSQNERSQITANDKQDPVNFKLKYLVKEFERIFKNITELNSELDKFEALEKSVELNQVLRLIARISSSVRMNDVLKLAEVTYVFLKYVRDYRMNLLDTEIQQIIKYIIFTFKMLLTNRKPEDFNVLVQHLNDPVKIFTEE